MRKKNNDTQDINGWQKNIAGMSVNDVLNKLDADIALRPEVLQPLTVGLLQRANRLVKDVDVGDIDLPLPEDEEE
jgi:hypothetical protein